MQAPEFSRHAVLEVLRAHYGLSGDLATLVSERDQNLRFTTDDGSRYVVKVASIDEAIETAEFQALALRHVAKTGPGVETPRLVPTRNGELLAPIVGRGRMHRLRVVSYVDGEPLPRAGLTPGLAASLGAALGRLDAALRDFDHPGKYADNAWDMQRAPGLRKRTDAISDLAIRDMVRDVLDEFEREVLQRFEGFRRQVIHNDANPENILTDVSGGAVKGFIDFGDMLEAPLIVEPAIAASYLRDTGDPWRLVRPFVNAYQSVIPLEADELAVLPLLIQTRLATTITMRCWRSAELGSTDTYARKAIDNESNAEAFLQLLRYETADQPLL